MTVRRKAAIVQDYPLADGVVFDAARRARIASLVDLYPHDLDGANLDAHADALVEGNRAPFVAHDSSSFIR